MLCPLFLGCLKFLFFKLDTSVKFLCKIVAKSPANRKCFATIVDISARLLYFRVGGSSSAGQLTTGTVCFSPFRGAWLLFRMAAHHWNCLLPFFPGCMAPLPHGCSPLEPPHFPSFRGAWLLFRRATHHWNHLLSPHSGVHGSFSAWLLTTGTAYFPFFPGCMAPLP